MARLGDLVVTIGAKTASFDKALGDSMRKLKNFGRNTQQLGRTLSMSVTAPLAAMGGLAVKTAASFEFSMAKVQAVSGFAADEMNRLEAQAKALGGSTSKSASDVAGLQLELAKLGKTSTEIEAMTESILSLSIAFDTDLGETSAVVGESLNQFGLSADQAGRVADNMATLFGSSALDLERFGSAMSVVGPTASAMGLSIEETGAALGVLVNAGVDASTAGTSLTKALTTLAAKGMNGKEAMSSLFNGTLSVSEGFDLFGDRAGKIIPILQKGGEQMALLTQKQLDGAGAAAKARSVLENTAQGGFDKLKSSVEALGIAFGDAMLPMVNQATDFISGLASKFASLDDTVKSNIVQIAAIVGVIGPLLFILPQIGAALTLMTGPIGLTIAALALLATAVYMFADEVSAPLADVANYFITLYNESDNVRRLIGYVKSAFVEQFKIMWSAVKSVSDLVIDLGTALWQMITMDFSGAWETIKSGFQDAFSTVADQAVESGKAIAESIAAEVAKEPIELVTPESIAAGIKSLGGLKDAFDNMFSGGGGGGGAGAPKMTGMSRKPMVNVLPERGLVAASGPVAAMAADMGKMRTEFSMMIDMGPQITSAFTGIGEAIGGLVSGTMTMADIMGQAFAGLGGFLMDLGAQFVSAGVAASAFYASLISNPPLAIAAGVALVAAGAAIKGFQSRAQQSPPALAKGGLAFGETMALVGDNPNAGTDPEVIAPLSKLQGMMGGGGQHVTVTGRISGRDILISNERAAADRSRNRGF